MKRLTALLLVIWLFVPAVAKSAQDDAQLEVANWSFSIVGAVKSPIVSEIIHLGALADGRDWLVVTMTATNTSAEEQEIHSDLIQLHSGGEMIKQTGAESASAAAELGYMSIGGERHKIESGQNLQVIQVFKVSPEATDFTLIFDFLGKWEVPIVDLVSEADGDPRALLGEDASSVDTASSASESPWSLSTSSFELTLIGAAVAPSFSGPFHLGMSDDGQSWLVVTYRIRNTTSDDLEISSETLRILSSGELQEQANDETESVADELSFISPDVDLGADEETDVVQVFAVAPDTVDSTLQVTSLGEWFLNLGPVISASQGDAQTLVPAGALDLASIEVESEVARAIPTAAPTETPRPTETPSPTQTPAPTGESEPTSLPSEAGSGDESEIEIALKEVSGSGVSGDATLTDNGDGTTTIDILVDGATGDQTALLRFGTCAEIGAPAASLTAVDEDGSSVTDTPIPLSSIQESGLTSYVVTIQLIEGDDSTLIACGQISEASAESAESPEQAEADSSVSPEEARAGRLGGTLEEIENRFGAPSWTDTGLVGYNAVSLGEIDTILVVYYDEDNLVHKLSLVYLEMPGAFDNDDTIARVVSDVTPGDGKCQDKPLSSSGLGTEVYPCSSKSLEDIYSASELEAFDVSGKNGSYSYSVDPTKDEYYEVIVQFGTDSFTAATVPVATSAPASTSQELTAEESAYLLTIMTQTDVMRNSLLRFAELAQADNIFSDEWIIDVAAELVLWDLTYQDALALTPPPRFAEVHALYLDALSHIVASGDEFAYGVDNLDASAFERASVEMQTGSELLRQATDALNELME